LNGLPCYTETFIWTQKCCLLPGFSVPIASISSPDQVGKFTIEHTD